MIHISPNTNGLPGIAELRVIVGATMTIALVMAVMAVLVAAITWGFGASTGNPNLAARGKSGVLIACGAAIVSGAAVALINFFWTVGQHVR